MVSLLVPALALTLRSAPQTAPDAAGSALYSTPAVRGDTVVFGYAGDLWVTDLKGSPARRLTSSPGLETTPRISPDGKTVAFVGMYEGGQEVYTIPLAGGEPTRLTYEAGGKPLFGFTPDGARVAYGSAARNFTNRQPALYTVPVGGGPAKASVLNEVASLGYFEGGEKVAFVRQGSENFNWRRYRGGSQGRISIYDFRTNEYRELPAGREQSFTPLPVGNSVFYTSDKSAGTLNLFRYDLASNRSEQLTRFTDVDVRTPATDGRTIAYERGGALYLYDIATKATRPLAPVVASENLGARPAVKSLVGSIDGVAIGDGGTRAYVAARGEILSVSGKTGETVNLTNSSGARDDAPLLSPDGKTLYYRSDKTTGPATAASGPGEPDVYARDLATGKERALRVSDLKPQAMTLSPDGAKLAVTTKDGQLVLVETATGKRTPMARSYAGVTSYAFSPDGKTLATVESEPNGFGRTYIQPTDGIGKKQALTAGAFDDTDLDFSPDGKYLYLASVRAIAPTFGQYEFSLKVEDATKLYVLPLRNDVASPLEDRDEDDVPAAPTSATPPPANPPANPPGTPPTNPPGGPPPTPPTEGGPQNGAEATPGNAGASAKAPASARPNTPSRAFVDLEGAEQRLVELPLPNGTYRNLVGVPGGVLYTDASGVLTRFDLAGRAPAPIAPLFGPTGPVAVAFSPKRTKLALFNARSVRVVDVRPGPPAPPSAGALDLGGLTARIDPRQEWRQIFWDVWRYERDTFYDPTFGGNDWRAIGNRYAAEVERANHRSDLTLILRRLVAELGTSHAYVQGTGDMGLPTGPAVAYLGADYRTDGTHIRFGKIYRGLNYASTEVGPLGTPALGVKEGDALLAVDGQTADPNEDPGKLLLGKAGRTVVLTVQSPGGPERRVRVRPVGSEYRLRYTDWVEGNRRKVSELSNGRIGYMHVSDTAAQGSIDFVRGFYPQVDKDALVVDERWNGGGYIQPFFVETLARRSRAYIARPGFPDVPEAVASPQAKVMLINGYAGSGGDFFPYLFRQAGLGPLVGTRTWGGLVGINNGITTVDGQSVTSPGFAIFDPKTNEIVAENQGIEPDVEVDLRPDLVAKGRDPQLEKAVEILMERIKNAPPRTPRKAVPRVGPKGRLGG